MFRIPILLFDGDGGSPRLKRVRGSCAESGQGQAVDITDLTTIWSACGFESPEQAADLNHAAYPHLQRDEYLVDEIRAIGERGSKSLGHPIR